MAGGALESRPAGTCRGHEKCAPGHRPWDGSGDSPVEHRTRRNFVPLAHGDSIAGCAGYDWRDAFDHGHLRNGCLLGEQAAQGVGNSRGSRRATQGSVAGHAGTCVQTVGDWFGGWIGSGSACDEGAGFHCVSGYAARSPGIDRYCSRDGVAGANRYVDSGATRAVGRSCDTSARGMTLSIEGDDRRMGLASDRTVYSSKRNRPLLLYGRLLDDSRPSHEQSASYRSEAAVVRVRQDYFVECRILCPKPRGLLTSTTTKDRIFE